MNIKKRVGALLVIGSIPPAFEDASAADLAARVARVGFLQLGV
jgi:hypothetical protein